ncbi:hypothetical protein EON80_17330 [bacterium]|nr:MAG: hypothetical protein EON80_17330 [bacterium]
MQRLRRVARHILGAMESSLDRSPPLQKAIEARPFGNVTLGTHFLRSPKKDVFFIYVDKVACTYLKHSLFQQMWGDLHGVNPEIFMAGWEHHDFLHAFAGEVMTVDGRDALSVPGAKFITFCRNPYDRLLSAFTDKVLAPRPLERAHFEWVRREVLFQGARRGKYRNYVNVFNEGVPFSEFVDFIAHQDVGKLDVHWTPQHLINLADIVPSTVIRLERFDEEFPKAWEEAIGAKTPTITRPEQNKSKRAFAPAIDQATADMIYEIYKTDFELFGYARDSWQSI